MRVCYMGAIDLAVMNKPVSSASAAENMTNLMIWVTVRTGPLSHGTALSSDRKMYAPTKLRALVLLRYPASESPQSIMSLEQ